MCGFVHVCEFVCCVHVCEFVCCVHVCVGFCVHCDICVYIHMCVVCVCVHMQKSKWALHLVTLVLKDKMGGWGTEWHQNINGESRQDTEWHHDIKSQVAHSQ